MADALPTADEFFGAPAAAPQQAKAPGLPTADDFFAVKPAAPAMPSASSGFMTALGASPPGQDEYLAQTPIGKILDAFGQGAKQGWGTDNTGISDETADWLKKVGIFNDASKGQTSLLRSFNEGLFRPLAAGVNLTAKTLGAAQFGVAGAAEQAGIEAGQPGLGRDVAGIVESAGGLMGSPGALGIHPAVADLDRARSVGAVGHDEAVYFGTQEPKPGDGQVIQPGLTLPEKPAEAQGTPPASPVPEEAAPPDVHTIARQIAPEVFQGPKGYDALIQQKDTFNRWIGELGDTRDQAATASIDAQIADTQARLEDATGKRAATYRDRLDDLQEQRQAALDDANHDTPGMARVRAELQKTDYAMRDLAPQVSAAYREAQSRMPPPETATEPQPQAAGVQEVAPASSEPVVAPEPTETPPAAADAVPGVEPAKSGPANQNIVTNIADDVSKKLVAAGRPQEEADAAAALVASHYEARAQNLGTTAQELYAKDGAEIEAGTKGRKGEAGRTVLKDGQATIRLMGSADASTFIHETGHQWLEELTRDAADERATDSVKADAKTVRDWLGTEEGEAIPTRAHEKFARGFERYLMEGRAPTAELSGVFAKFKDWLTSIYQTVSKLRSPITDDIRDVFDRLISKPSEGTVIAPDRGPGKTFADIHEAEAQTTPPERAAQVADNVRSEIDQQAKQGAPEVHAELNPNGEAGGIAPENANPPSGGNAPEPVSRENGPPRQSGAVAASGNDAAAAGGELRAATGEPSRDAIGGARPERYDPNSVTERDSPLDKAGNIRPELLNFNDADAAANLLHRLAAADLDFNDSRFGTRAYQWALDVKAAGQMVVETVNRAVELEKKWLASDNEADGAEYVRAREQAMIASQLLAEVKSGSGRALAANRRVPQIAEAQNLADFIEQNTNKTLFQIRDEGKLLSQLDTPAKQAKFLEDSGKTTWQKTRSYILSYFINNLISGPLTHAAYSIGNTTWALFKVGADVTTAAGIDAIREYMRGAPLENRVHFAEVPAALTALYRGWRDALPAAATALKTGIPFMQGAEEMAKRAGEPLPSAEPPRQTIPGKVGYVLETPSRSVTAIHTLFYAANYTAEIARRAVRSALNAGLDGDAYNTHVADFIAKPPDLDVAQAHDEALKMVLMKQPPFDGFMGNLNRAVNSNLAAKIVMPFMQIGSNILREGLVEHSPLGIASSEVRDNLSGKNGAIAQSTQYAKIAVGTTAAVSTVGLAMEGLITGGGPASPSEQRIKRATGWLPYSIKVGDTYIPYRKFLGPLGPLIGGAADLYEVGHAAGTDGFSKAASSLIMGMSEVVMDETWMSGLSNFTNAAKNWDQDGGKYLRGLATDFIPFSIGLGQVARLVDPYQREVKTLTDAIKNKIPFMSQDLHPMRDMWGEPMTGRTMLSPSAAVTDPATQTLAQLDYAPAKPQGLINGIRLTPEQYDDYTRIAGRTAHMRINALVTAPGFQARMAEEPGRALKSLQDIISNSRAGARQQILMQSAAQDGDNSIAAQAYRAKQAKITGVPVQ